MKHIAFLLANYSGDGGTTRVTSVISSRLSEVYHISVICIVKPGEMHYNFKDYKNPSGGGEIKFFNLNRSRVEISANNILGYLWDCKRIYSIIKKENIDCLVVVDTYLYLYLWPIKLFRKRKKLCTIAWEHFSYLYTSRKRQLARNISMKYADAIVVLSKADEKLWIKAYQKPQKIKTIYNPITVKVEGKADIYSKQIIAVGHLSEEKGFDMLLEAWKLCYKELNEWKLLIIGEGKDRTKLDTFIIENGMPNVKLCSFQRDISQFYKESSILAFSSRHEGFPLVMIESQAYGLPAVAFHCEVGPKEYFINEYNALTVEVGDVEGFANALIKLTNNIEIRKRLSLNAISSVKEFNLEDIIIKWMQILNELGISENRDNKSFKQK